MNRDQLSKKINWPWIIWILGMLNVGTMLPQLYKIIATHQTEGISLTMFVIVCFMQSAYAVHGFFTKDKMLMVTMALSAVVTACIVGTILYLQLT